MESRFAHLCKRDTSVSMLRVKMSRRRSQSQKENRERTVNTRRQLEKLPEMDVSSLDASVAVANMSVIQEKTLNTTKPAKKEAVEERLKQLERWKERKALEKEKGKREKERKGIFRTGIYHPKDFETIVVSLPTVPAASTRAKEIKVSTASSQSTRITRSMKQQQQQQQQQQQAQRRLKMQDPNTAAIKAQPALQRSTRSQVGPVKSAPIPAKTKPKVAAVEPVVRTLSARSANRHPAHVTKDQPENKSADVRTTRSKALVNVVHPTSIREKGREESLDNFAQPAVPMEPEMEESEERTCPLITTPCTEIEDGMVDQVQADSVSAAGPFEALSFAPKDFIFQAPSGLPSFKFEPLTPRSADAFLTPSLSFSLPPAPEFNVEPQDEPDKPSPPKSPQCSPPRAPPTVAPLTPASPVESKHDVPYFRLEIANETDRLTTLCVNWEDRMEDESIPEEMRDRMRTAVGQARLLMKERFNQFSGLVDDCELGRGEKITTCTDLQGFWDMVYYQVEDVKKKFDALKEAETRGWVEEHKPPPRQKKGVKKPSAAPAKLSGNKAAAKSRLAAVKAAMRAKQQEAEKADSGSSNSQDPPLQAVPQPADSVVFDGGFYQVKSPAKPSGSLRRSSRLSVAVLPHASPCSDYFSPRRFTRQSLALMQTPVQAAASPAQSSCTPARLGLNQTSAETPKSQRGTPQPTQNRGDAVNLSVCSSPVKEVLLSEKQPNRSPACQSEPVSEFGMPTLPVVEEPVQQAELVNFDLPLSPCKTPPFCQPPELSTCLSFTVSPCMTPSRAPISQESMCHTADNSAVEEIPGLDFEQYLQPSLRCSLSPRDTVGMETLSPMAVDVEMESPMGQPKDLLTRQDAALPVVSSLSTLQSPQTQVAESALLLFTPDLKDRIRQSVCPTDLMVFTPPL